MTKFINMSSGELQTTFQKATRNAVDTLMMFIGFAVGAFVTATTGVWWPAAVLLGGLIAFWTARAIYALRIAKTRQKSWQQIVDDIVRKDRDGTP
jgi:hypothetical protein